jgi:hypothetical protein
MHSASSSDAKRSPARSSRPPGREQRGRLGRRREDPAEDLEDVRHLGLCGTPARASAAAGAARSASGTVPNRARRLGQPAGVPYVPPRRADVERLDDVPEPHVDRDEVGAPRHVGPRPGGLDEEVEQRRRLARAGDEQVAAAPGPVRSGSATHDASTAATAASTALPPSRRTAAPRLGGHRMPGRHDSPTRAHRRHLDAARDREPGCPPGSSRSRRPAALRAEGGAGPGAGERGGSAGGGGDAPRRGGRSRTRPRRRPPPARVGGPDGTGGRGGERAHAAMLGDPGVPGQWGRPHIGPGPAPGRAPTRARTARRAPGRARRGARAPRGRP